MYGSAKTISSYGIKVDHEFDIFRQIDFTKAYGTEPGRRIKTMMKRSIMFFFEGLCKKAYRSENINSY